MILSTLDPPSPADRLEAYYAARARVEGFHPSDLASRAARGLSFLRRMAWIERSHHLAGAQPAACRHAIAGRRLPNSRAPGSGQGALTHAGIEYARTETLDGRYPTTDTYEADL